MSKTLFRIGLLFLGIGLLLLGLAGYSLVADRQFADQSLSAKGTVVALVQQRGGDGGSTFAPVVEWTDESGRRHRFQSSTSSNPAGFSRGDSVTVLYNPERPDRAVIDTFGQRYTGMLIFGGIGLVFALIGGPIAFIYLRRQHMIRWLKRHGTILEADFVRCEIDRSTVIGGRNPYRVHAQAKHPRTGKLASFISEPVFVDFTGELEGKKVPVRIDRHKYGPHYVDLSRWLHEEERA